MRRIEARANRGRAHGSAPSRRALVTYGAAWLVAAALVAVVAVVLLDGEEPDAVSLPPVEAIELTDAARAAGCELRRERHGERLNPPVSGAAGVVPARAGTYDDAPDIGSLVAALRHGVIVIHVRGDLDEESVDLLRSIQEAAPNGTIVTPNETDMRYAVAVTAYRRLLACERLTEASLEALQLFRGRYVGSGPDT
jgi:Protein of unknown function (DUF3105)